MTRYITLMPFVWTTILVNPDNKVHRANMGPNWGRQDPGGPNVGRMKIAIWEVFLSHLMMGYEQAWEWWNVLLLKPGPFFYLYFHQILNSIKKLSLHHLYLLKDWVCSKYIYITTFQWFSITHSIRYRHCLRNNLRPLLLTWINVNPSMDMLSHA